MTCGRAFNLCLDEQLRTGILFEKRGIKPAETHGGAPSTSEEVLERAGAGLSAAESDSGYRGLARS